MAFLDNSGDIILDAVLTDTGRMRLAKGDGSFNITKFALGDDEINYGLYDKNHPSGSAYFDIEILQTPVLEAFTNNASTMKSKLLSISRTNLLYLPEVRNNSTDGIAANSSNNVVRADSTGNYKFSKFKSSLLYGNDNDDFYKFKKASEGNTIQSMGGDDKIISYNKIIEYFFEIHDPTTLNLQGPDKGTQYRSEIFYLNESQKKIAEEIINLENKKLSGKVVTKLSILKNYCPAEEYHQKYLEKR